MGCQYNTGAGGSRVNSRSGSGFVPTNYVSRYDLESLAKSTKALRQMLETSRVREVIEFENSEEKG